MNILPDNKCHCSLYRFLWIENTDTPILKSEELMENTTIAPMHCLFDVISSPMLALDVLTHIPYSAIFIHSNLCDIDPLVLIKMIHQSGIPIPIVYVTAQGREEDQEPCQEDIKTYFSPFGVLSEPISPDDLCSIIQNIEEKYQLYYY